MDRARALEAMLSADDYGADLAERYGWINRALPAAALGEFVRSLSPSGFLCWEHKSPYRTLQCDALDRAPIASAAASPSIGTPRMIPKIGPGNEMAVKNSVLIRPYATPTLPLAASSPATTKDLRSRGTANAATDRTATAMPGHGASPACRAPPIAMTTTNTTSAAAASPTASMVLEFVIELFYVSHVIAWLPEIRAL
jgi:hypothetical protein